MTRFAVAMVAGIALSFLLLLFPPAYFPWALLIAAMAGVLTGIAGNGGGLRRHVADAIAAVLLLVLTVVAARLRTGFVSPALFVTSWWLIAPILLGVAIGVVARHKLGSLRALAVSAGGVGAVALLGAALAVAVAPAQVSNVPACVREECPRSACWMMSERRRVLAIERVTRYDGGAITCVYTGWGGVHVGTVVASPGGGSSWDDGWWPRSLR